MEAAAERLVEGSVDIRVALLMDPAGGLLAAAGSNDDREAARELAALGHELVVAADRAAPEPTVHIEVQTGRGTVFAVRDARWTVVCVAGRLALSSLVLYDLRQALLELPAAA